MLRVAIVDYGMGNLFSVKNACEYTGMHALITSSPTEIVSADAVILPGVGAFGDAMESLKRLDLIAPLKEVALSPKLFVGICLGMQLLMAESEEFGRHYGLGIIEGRVVRLPSVYESVGGRRDLSSGNLKVPQVGWNQIFKRQKFHSSPPHEYATHDTWDNSPLSGLCDGEFVYFAHSFYVKPDNPNAVLSVTRYGNMDFCSSLQHNNIFACQFHPERSGPKGLHIYRQIHSLGERRKVLCASKV